MPHQRYGFHQSLYMRDTYESFVLGRLFPLGFSFSPESCSDVHSTYKGGWAGGRPAQSIRMGWPVGRSPTPYLWWAKLRAEFATARLWSGRFARLGACSIKTRPSMLALPSARACESAPFDANPPSTPAPPVLCVCLMSVRGPCYHLVRAGVITLKLWR